MSGTEQAEITHDGTIAFSAVQSWTRWLSPVPPARAPLPPSPAGRRVSFCDQAADDLIDLWHRHQGNGGAAWRLLDAIITAVSTLHLAPCTWPVSKGEPVRVFRAANCRVTYRVSPDTNRNATAGDVLILRIDRQLPA